METDRKIIIAVDDSETSAYAFTWALHHLFKKSDKVIVLTAAPFVTLDYPSTDIASGTYTYIHVPLFLHILDFQRFLLLLFNSSSWNRSLYCVVDVVFFFFSFCVCGCLEARSFSFFLPSLCVEPSSRSSLPKCSIA